MDMCVGLVDRDQDDDTRVCWVLAACSITTILPKLFINGFLQSKL